MGGFLGGSAVGGMTLIESKTVSGAAVTSVTFSSLDADTDKIYYLWSFIDNASGSAANIELIPNGGSPFDSASDIQRINAEGTTMAAVRAVDETPYCQVSGNAQVFASALIHLPTGFRRCYTSWGVQDLGASLIYRGFGGQWDDTSTSITSLQVLSNQANGIDVNSEFHLYKLAI